MANSYKKVYLHIVFAVKHRKSLLHKDWRHRLFQYTSKVLESRGHYPLAVNGYNDHIHIFISYSCKELVSDLVRELKKSMSNFIKTRNLCNGHFEWQNGYGVFSNSYREIDQIINYIMRQEEHHRKKSFQKEYLNLLKKYEIEFKDEYMFDFF